MKRVFHFNTNLLQRSISGTSATLSGTRAVAALEPCSYAPAHQPIGARKFHSTGKVNASKNSVPLAENLVFAPEEAAQAIIAAKYNVWGEIQGTNERSGRKWLRQKLRGPQVRGWYGINFRDVFPEYITPIKQEIYEEEQSMHRFGKGSSKGGKVKPPKKYMVDSMDFESKVEDILEEVEWSNYTELLTEEELTQRKALLSSCASAEDAEIIEDLFKRIAAEREANMDKWEAKLIEDEAKDTEDGAGEKKRRVSNFKFREGLADKRLWGQEPASSRGAKSTETDAVAETAADSGEVRFDVDIRGMKQSEIDEVYAKFVAEKAKAEWQSLNEMKESVEYGIFYRDLEKTLTTMNLPVSEEGLMQLYMLDEDSKSATIATALANPPPKKKQAPVETPVPEEAEAEAPEAPEAPEADDAAGEKKE